MKKTGGMWIICLVFLWVTASAQTDPNDFGVLQSFLKGLANPDTLGWSGNDSCGSGWPHIQCKGSFVTGISVAGAGLIGTLTPDLNKLSQLQYLSLQKNSFSGALPSLSGLQNLQTVYLNDNNFDAIPGDFFQGLLSLQTIYLDYNSLNSSTGWTLPPDVASCSQLTNLSLTNTSLTGEIPEFLGTMPSLKVLNLAYNKLSGGIPSSFAGSNLIQLEANNMLGPVLTGPIDAVGSMTSLMLLWLQVNAITGIIPVGLSNASTLKDLKLNDNKITGVIPPNLTALPLSVFTVENNLLLGPLPVFPPAVSFAFSGNQFCQATAGAPCAPEVNALLEVIGALGYPVSVVSSWSGNNPCNGWIGIACDVSGHVSSINLPDYHLNGTLSPAIGGLSSLTYLKLSSNNITGPIPSSLTHLKSLKLVDLSNNDISGPVPIFPAQVTLDLVGNSQIDKGIAPSPPSSSPQSSSPIPNVTHSAPPSQSGVPPASVGPGTIPSSAPASNSANSSSNPQIGTSGNSTSSHGDKKSSSNSVGVIVGAGIGAIALILVILVVFLLHRKRKHKFMHLQGHNALMVHPQDSGSEGDTVMITVAGDKLLMSEAQSRNKSGPSDLQIVETGNLVISIEVLRAATKNFSEDSILGRGGFGVVYKGELEDGTVIAVKRMEAAIVSSKGINEFQAEIEVLTKVRHRHLVGLLGYCIDGYEKLLVYEFLPNGTLAQHLFDYIKMGWKPLNWKTRLSIALDVARGMEYLHGLAHKSFIHRDLKPSNILLDDDYRAKVSDFGLVKLAPEGKHSVETKLAGTFGYLAPEYAVTGRVTTKADVFSFGVVLMELISGRKALDETQSEENLHLVAWFRRMQASRESFTKVMDPAFEVDAEAFQSICTVAELAGHCTAREPYQRPDMGHAVNVLAPLVEKWKPRDVNWDDAGGIDVNLTLQQAMKKWQDFDFSSASCMEDSQTSLPTRPAGFADSFTSADGR